MTNAVEEKKEIARTIIYYLIEANFIYIKMLINLLQWVVSIKLNIVNPNW